jgi:hypothetical protein
LHRRLGFPATDQDGFLTIGRSDQGINAQVNTDNGLLWPGLWLTSG